MEVFLCIEGYGSVYEQNISEQKKDTVTAGSGTPEYWEQVTNAQGKNSKPMNTLAVIEKIDKKGEQGVPTQLREIIEVALELAREAG